MSTYRHVYRKLIQNDFCNINVTNDGYWMIMFPNGFQRVNFQSIDSRMHHQYSKLWWSNSNWIGLQVCIYHCRLSLYNRFISLPISSLLHCSIIVECTHYSIRTINWNKIIWKYGIDVCCHRATLTNVHFQSLPSNATRIGGQNHISLNYSLNQWILVGRQPNVGWMP